MRAKVGHPFLRMKRVFGYWKSLPPSPIGGALPGSGEEHQRLAMLLGLGNLMTAQRHLTA